MQELVKFSERLREAMEEKGIGQKEFAELLFTTQPSISRWLSGKQRPDYETLFRICYHLNEEPGYLMGYDYDEVEQYEKDISNQKLLINKQEQQTVADDIQKAFVKELYAKYGYLRGCKRQLTPREEKGIESLAKKYGMSAIEAVEKIEEKLKH